MYDFDYQQCTKTAYTQKNQHFDAKSAQNLHILKTLNKHDSQESPNLHILKKKQKNQKLIHLCQSVPHRVWIFCFFEYMQVWWLFPIKTFDFFEYMQVWWLFPIKFLIFFEYMQVWGTWSSPNLHILKKKTTFWCQKCTKPAYTQKNQKKW